LRTVRSGGYFRENIDVTLGWAPETDLTPLKVDDEIGSHVLVSDTGPVRVIPTAESWPEREVKPILRDG
jgi:hypothetical protein